jgi:hypothetical protein
MVGTRRRPAFARPAGFSHLTIFHAVDSDHSPRAFPDVAEPDIGPRLGAEGWLIPAASPDSFVDLHSCSGSRAPMPKMSTLDLKAMLAAERSSALAAMTAAQLMEDRAQAMSYYLGDVSADMPVVDGRSATVSMDVADTIEGLMPNLMDIFAGSDEVVRFEPVGPEDEAAAQQETDYVNHVFMQQNPGFMVLYSFIKDALLSKVGIVKVWWEEREEEQRETYYDLTEDQFAMLAQAVAESDGAMEIVEHTVHNGSDHDHANEATS